MKLGTLSPRPYLLATAAGAAEGLGLITNDQSNQSALSFYEKRAPYQALLQKLARARSQYEDFKVPRDIFSKVHSPIHPMAFYWGLNTLCQRDDLPVTFLLSAILCSDLGPEDLPKSFFQTINQGAPQEWLTRSNTDIRELNHDLISALSLRLAKIFERPVKAPTTTQKSHKAVSPQAPNSPYNPFMDSVFSENFQESLKIGLEEAATARETVLSQGLRHAVAIRLSIREPYARIAELCTTALMLYQHYDSDCREKNNPHKATIDRLIDEAAFILIRRRHDLSRANRKKWLRSQLDLHLLCTAFHIDTNLSDPLKPSRLQEIKETMFPTGSLLAGYEQEIRRLQAKRATLRELQGEHYPRAAQSIARLLNTETAKDLATRWQILPHT